MFVVAIHVSPEYLGIRVGRVLRFSELPLWMHFTTFGTCPWPSCRGQCKILVCGSSDCRRTHQTNILELVLERFWKFENQGRLGF